MTTLYPLLPEQARFLTRDLAGEHHWNVSRLFRVPPELTPDLVATAFRAVLNRHDGLRTGLREGDRTEWGVAVPRLDTVELVPVDLRDLPETERVKALTEHCATLQASLSLTEPPLSRIGYFVMSDTERRVLVTLHHFLCDGVSWHLLVSELQRACKLLLQGKDLERALPATGMSACDFARWLRELASSGALNEHIPLWQQIGRPDEPVPVDHAAENTLETEDAVVAELDRETTARLVDGFLPEHMVGMQEVILTAAVGAVHGSGREHSMRAILIGHGRTGLPGQPFLDRTIGWLAAAYPVTLSLDTRQGLAGQLDTTRAVFQRIPHEGTSFGVLRYMSPDPWVREGLAALGAPDIMVNYFGELFAKTRTGLLASADEPIGPARTPTGPRILVHAISGHIMNGMLRLEWYYSKNQFRTSTIEGYLDELLGGLRAAVGAER
jgi:non-ribosomal peptide synthase protein (TIGR01720 family)